MPLTADTSEPLLITGTPDVTDVTFRQIRQLSQAFDAGVVGAGDMLVSAPGGMNVSVASGYAWVPGSTITGPEGQHKYGVPLTAAKTLGTITAPVGATRRDSIIARVYDEGDAPGAGLNVGRVEYRVNPAESLTAEALPANSLLLGYSDVTVGAAAITSAMLTDMRKPATHRLDTVQAFTATGTIKAAGGRIVTFTGAAAQTLTLPPAEVGREFEIYNIDASDGVTIARGGADTIIDYLTTGATAFRIPAGARASFVCVAAGVWRAAYVGAVTKSGNYTPTAGTGVKAITGVGFRPRAVQFNVALPSGAGYAPLGSGSMSADGSQGAVSAYIDSVGNIRALNVTDGAVYIVNGAGAAALKAAFSAMGDDGFSLNFSTTDTTARISYLAIA